MNIKSLLTAYFDEISFIHGSGQGTVETSYYPALKKLFDGIGRELSPCVTWLSQGKNVGAGHPDFLLIAETAHQDVRAAVERQARELVSEKREVEYEDRRLQVGDAAKMVELAERVVTAVERAVGNR